MKQLKRLNSPTFISFTGLIIVWQLAVISLEVAPFVLPSPLVVAKSIYNDSATGLIFPHLIVTTAEFILGFIAATVVGVALGVTIALVPPFEKYFYPLLVAFQSVPKIAVAPLFIIWFGFGMHTKVITASLVSFFPVLVNVVTGMKSVDERRLLLMRSLNATGIQTFMKLSVPSILPVFFASLEVCVMFTLIGVVVAEFLGSPQGLGSLILQRQGAVDVAGVFSALFYLSAMGVISSALLRVLAKRLIK